MLSRLGLFEAIVLLDRLRRRTIHRGADRDGRMLRRQTYVHRGQGRGLEYLPLLVQPQVLDGETKRPALGWQINLQTVVALQRPGCFETQPIIAAPGPDYGFHDADPAAAMAHR